MSPLAPLRHPLHTWSVAAQLHARRNAMVALTDCTRRRAERDDVERFLAARTARRRGAAPDAAVSLHA
jgi:hypothetical protein